MDDYRILPKMTQCWCENFKMDILFPEDVIILINHKGYNPEITDYFFAEIVKEQQTPSGQFKILRSQGLKITLGISYSETKEY